MSHDVLSVIHISRKLICEWGQNSHLSTLMWNMNLSHWLNCCSICPVRSFHTVDFCNVEVMFILCSCSSFNFISLSLVSQGIHSQDTRVKDKQSVASDSYNILIWTTNSDPAFDFASYFFVYLSYHLLRTYIQAQWRKLQLYSERGNVWLLMTNVSYNFHHHIIMYVQFENLMTNKGFILGF